MTDETVKTVVSDVENAARTAVASAEGSAQSAVKAEVAKQEGWLKANLKPVLIGLVAGVVLGWLLHAIL